MVVQAAPQTPSGKLVVPRPRPTQSCDSLRELREGFVGSAVLVA